MKKLLLLFLTFITFNTIFIGFRPSIGMGYEWRNKVHSAILNNNLTTLKKLCYTKEHANTIYPSICYFPLHLATFYKNTKIISYLCSIGANVNALDHDNRTPLLLLVISLYDWQITGINTPNLVTLVDCINLLLKNGSDVSLKGDILKPLGGLGPFCITVNPVEYLLFNISNNFKSAVAIKLLELFIPYSPEAVDYFSTHNPQVLLKYIKLSHAQKNNTPNNCSIVPKILSQQLGSGKLSFK